jgi:hypothetical protein
MFGFKKKKKPAPTKEKKSAAKTNAGSTKAKGASKKVARANTKTSLRPIKEAKSKKPPKEVIEDYKKPEFVRKQIKLQSKKILTAEGWKRLLKGND